MNEIVKKVIQQGQVEEKLKERGLTNININLLKSNMLAIANQDGLDKATPGSILGSCLQAMLLNLPLEKNFGYCYVVPYWDNNRKASNGQFQMGYKGYIQLAIRSQQYKNIGTNDVRKGEIDYIDPLKGITFNWIQNSYERDKVPIIGYAAYFELTSGFTKCLYMSKEQMEQHFMTYSKAYAKNKSFPLASFDDMAKKTILTQLLRRWGIMSVEMQQAYQADQAILIDNEKIYIDNPKTKFTSYDEITKINNTTNNLSLDDAS